MISTTIFPGRYIQGKAARMCLDNELSRFGVKGLIICGPIIYENMISEFKSCMNNKVSVVFERFGGECSDEEIDRLRSMAESANAHFIVGLGGGKTLDTAKAVAYQMKLPVATVPTIAATDAPCSSLSVIYTPDGSFKRYLFLPRNPDLVVLDTEIIANAPVRFLVSGMGDALATWFEAESCMKKYAPNMTGSIGSMTAYALAKLCYDTIITYGVAAKTSCESHVVTPALEHIVEASTLLSGLGFESGGLAAAHAIHNGLTVLEQTHRYYHGEKVAIGVLSSLFLTDKRPDIIDDVYSFCESVCLPTTLEDIGLGAVTDKDLHKVAVASCAEGETIHNEPFPVDSDMVVSSLRIADAEGMRRKKNMS